jgi:predicted amidophosphoribosyltransferase
VSRAATKTCRGCGQPKERDGYQLCSPCAEARYDELHSGRCGYRWEDPFGETNECGKPSGHDGGHLATWALGNGRDDDQGGKA